MKKLVVPKYQVWEAFRFDGYNKEEIEHELGLKIKELTENSYAIYEPGKFFYTCILHVGDYILRAEDKRIVCFNEREMDIYFNIKE